MQEKYLVNHVGTRLYEIRKDQGLRQSQFAQKLNISVGAYRNYERGQRDLPLRVAQEVSRLYQVNLRWLVTGGGYKYESELQTLLQRCWMMVNDAISRRPDIAISSCKRAQVIGIVSSRALKSGLPSGDHVESVLDAFAERL